MEYGGVVAIIGAVAAAAGAILGLLGKWLLDWRQKRSDVTVAELKADVEAKKTERELVFNEAMKLLHTAQEREDASEKEKAVLRDENVILRHKLSDCKDRLRQAGLLKSESTGDSP